MTSICRPIAAIAATALLLTACGSGQNGLLYPHDEGDVVTPVRDSGGTSNPTPTTPGSGSSGSDAVSDDSLVGVWDVQITASNGSTETVTHEVSGGPGSYSSDYFTMVHIGSQGGQQTVNFWRPNWALVGFGDHHSTSVSGDRFDPAGSVTGSFTATKVPGGDG